MKHYTAEEWVCNSVCRSGTYWREADGEDYLIDVPIDWPFMVYGLRGDKGGSIIVTGEGDGNSYRDGDGEGNAFRIGGKGSAWRFGKGNGSAYRFRGKGSAWRDGKGNGDAICRQSIGNSNGSTRSGSGCGHSRCTKGEGSTRNQMTAAHFQCNAPKTIFVEGWKPAPSLNEIEKKKLMLRRALAVMKELQEELELEGEDEE